MENEQTSQVTFTVPEVVDVTHDSISIKWNCEIEGVPEDSVKFEIFVKGQLADGSPFDRVEAPERNACTITGLKEETAYSIYVIAVRDGEDIAQTPEADDGLMVTTLKKTPPQRDWKKIAIIAGSVLVGIALIALLIGLLKPKNVTDTLSPTIDNALLSVTEKTDNMIAIAWNPATDNISAPEAIRYYVYRTTESGEWMDSQEVQGETSFTFTDLVPKTTYQFRVEALDEAGNRSPYTELSESTPDSTVDIPDNNYSIIFTEPETVNCNGVYEKDAVAMDVELDSLFNRSNFVVSFDYYILATDKDSDKNDNIITFDSTYRALGLIMKDGTLHVTTNNGKNVYDTGIPYNRDVWDHIDMALVNGDLIINGKLIHVGNIRWFTSRFTLLSSRNFSNGHAFKGKIRNLVVKS